MCVSFCFAKIVPSGKFPIVSCQSGKFFTELNSSHMSAPICACVTAVSGQWRGGTGPGSDRRGWWWVADLWDHIIRLPALQLLPNQPLHLLSVGVCVPSQPLILTHRNRWNVGLTFSPVFCHIVILAWFYMCMCEHVCIHCISPLWLRPAACPARLSS